MTKLAHPNVAITIKIVLIITVLILTPAHASISTIIMKEQAVLNGEALIVVILRVKGTMIVVRLQYLLELLLGLLLLGLLCLRLSLFLLCVVLRDVSEGSRE